MLLAAARSDPTNPTHRRSLGRLGLPAAMFGGFGFVKILVSVQLLRIFEHVRPVTGVVIAATLFLMVGGYLSHARVSGTRSLPADVRIALRGDHRNYALGWLGSAGMASFPLAAWAALAPPGHGRSAPLAIGLLVFGASALSFMFRRWTGPFPNLLPVTTAWFARRRAAGRP